MPEKKHRETPEEQSERFRKEVQRLIDAGELNPIEADERFLRTLDAGLTVKRKAL